MGAELAIPPLAILFVGGALAMLLRGGWRATALVLVPVASLIQHIGYWISLEPGRYWNLELAGQQLTLLRLDGLSLAFGAIFHVALVVASLYAWHVRDWVQQVAGLVYAAAAIGAVYAGDLVTLFIYWELTAIASVFLIWAARTERAYATGMRYLIIQVGSGVLLLSGVAVQFWQTGSIAFDPMTLGGLASWLIFLAFGMKCAFPFLHNWLQDAYPEATVTGTVFLSAFTTKLAVYALARGFAGTEILIPIGVVMTLFPIFFAVIENDLRRVLAYSLNNQLGFMVVGIGIGTELAIAGTVAHAICHIVYKALLFMSVGAVLYRVGTAKATELGGLHKSMPWTTGFCIVGAASISAFPLFSGFVSKSMILSAAGYEHLQWALLGLIFASAGVMEHSGIKIPYFAFFAHDSGKRPAEAPWNMLAAMGFAAFFCIAVALPGAVGWFYKVLPGTIKYEAYTTSHVMTQLQLLLFAALAFGVLIKTKLYPAEIRSTVLDFDWIYRRALPDAIRVGGTLVGALDGALRRGAAELGAGVLGGFRALLAPGGRLPHMWPTRLTTLWVVVTLVAFLLLYYGNRV